MPELALRLSKVVQRMTELSDKDFVFVEVTKTFMMTKAQAQKLVRVARLICSDREMISTDDDGTELRTHGEDFLTDEGDHDYAEATGQIPDPEGLLDVELIACATSNLDARQVQEISRFWPEDWRSEAMDRLGGSIGKSSKDGSARS